MQGKSKIIKKIFHPSPNGQNPPSGTKYSLNVLEMEIQQMIQPGVISETLTLIQYPEIGQLHLGAMIGTNQMLISNNQILTKSGTTFNYVDMAVIYKG